MKLFLGAMTAAVLFGVGCAHNRETSKPTGMSGSPRASVESAQQVPGYACQVIDTSASGASGAAQSQTVESESPAPGAVSGGAQEGSATGGLAVDEGVVSGGTQEDTAIGGSAVDEGVMGGSQEGNVTGGTAAPQGGAVSGGAPKDKATGGAPKDKATGGAATQDDAYQQDTGMGGGGGGGG